MNRDVGTIGPSVVVVGELSAKEDLTICGRVEGTIELTDNVLVIGPHAQIQADVLATVVNVEGTVHGDIAAIETITLQETARVDGALTARRVGIVEGASFRGKIEMAHPEVSDDPAKTAGKSRPAATRPAETARR